MLRSKKYWQVSETLGNFETLKVCETWRIIKTSSCGQNMGDVVVKKTNPKKK